jgi:uncharacterized membrane protein YdcZ (DUF606 family)
MYWSILIGMVGVLQAGLNRQITKDFGLLGATFFNTFIMLLMIGILYGIGRAYPQYFSGALDIRIEQQNLKWWLILPALGGLIFVMGIPSLIPKFGAQSVFLGIVVGQMVCSLGWDLFVEQMPFDTKRAMGASLAILGLAVANWKS